MRFLPRCSPWSLGSDRGTARPPEILVGIGIVVVALLVSSSGAVAKGQFVSWENWDLQQAWKPLNVEYVWNSNYEGIDFPKDRTRVFTVRAPARSVYWRATTLDAFTNDHWREDLYSLFSQVQSNPVQLTDDPLLPPSARDRSRWTRADVTVDALRDVHLVGPSQPVQYDTQEIDAVQYEVGGVARAFRQLGGGAEYTVWGYTPQPLPAKLAKSPATYPPEIALEGATCGFRTAALCPRSARPSMRNGRARTSTPPPMGSVTARSTTSPSALRGRATNPYAAAVALEAYFRSAGGFVYDEHPPRAGKVAPLVHFVTTTKRGYCQHFAGAMALMLRYLGVPARVAAGFSSGVDDEQREQWTVYDRDAHTWVEVWFNGYGWLPFDPTGGTLGGPYTTSSTRFDATGAAGVLSTSAIGLGGRRLLRFEMANLRGETPTGNTEPSEAAQGSSSARQDEQRGPSTVLFIVLGVLVAALLFVLGKLALRRSRYWTRDPRRIAAACRRELVEFLRDQRIDVPPSAGTDELGEFLGRRAGVDATELADALGRARYGPVSGAREAAREARHETKSVRRGLRQALPPGRRFRGMFSLRSLFAS